MGKRISHWVYGCVSVLVGTALLYSCIETTPPPPLKVGTNIWAGYEPLYAARSLNFFTSDEVKLVEYRSANQVSIALREGVIDAGALTYDEAVRMSVDGSDLTLILVMDVSAGGDVVLLKPDLKGLGDLGQRCIAYEHNAVGEYMFYMLAQHYDFDRSGLCQISSDSGDHLATYQRDDVGAIITFEPFARLLKSAGAQEIFSSKDIPYSIVDVLVVRDDKLMEKSENIEALISAWFQTLALQDTNYSLFLQQMRLRIKSSVPEFESMLNGIELPDRASNAYLLEDKNWRQAIHHIMCEMDSAVPCPSVPLKATKTYVQQSWQTDGGY